MQPGERQLHLGLDARGAEPRDTPSPARRRTPAAPSCPHPGPRGSRARGSLPPEPPRAAGRASRTRCAGRATLAAGYRWASAQAEPTPRPPTPARDCTGRTRPGAEPLPLGRERRRDVTTWGRRRSEAPSSPRRARPGADHLLVACPQAPVRTLPALRAFWTRYRVVPWLSAKILPMAPWVATPMVAGIPPSVTCADRGRVSPPATPRVVGEISARAPTTPASGAVTIRAWATTTRSALDDIS